jgi:predicted Zn-dependent protease
MGIAAAACAVNPVTGKKQLSLMSEEDEIAIGSKSDPQIVAEFGLYDDPKVAAYVDRVGQKMAGLSHRPSLKWTFRVLDSPVINAFALPGGYCYITRGILAHMNNEAELAVVVGHEIGHVTARHGASQQTRQTLAGLGLGLGSILSPQVARYGQVAQQALGLMFLKYGRDDENQSDDLGVEYSMRAGYDATAGSHFFEVLDRQQKESGQSLPSWASSHPAPADRVEHTQKLAAERKPQHPDATKVGEAEHKQIIDGIVYGDDPRQGFMQGDTFLHPQLGFQLSVPSGWKTQNTPSAFMTGSPDQKAVLQMTLAKADAQSPEATAATAAQRAQAQILRGQNEKVGGAPAWIGVLRVPMEDGTSGDFLVAFVQRKEGMFQIIGQTVPGALGQYEPAMLRSIRSLQDLKDEAARKIEPNRLRIEPLKSAATLAQAVERGGAVAAPLKTVALLNNLQPESNLPAGFKLKMVRGNYRPPATAGD